MKDLDIDDKLTEKLLNLVKRVMYTVIDEVDDAEEAEFVLAFCHDFVQAKLGTEDQGASWLKEEKVLPRDERYGSTPVNGR